VTAPSATTLNFVRAGTGEPLLLIHGIGHRWQGWRPVIDLLAAHHDVIAVDLPGFGESPVPPAGMPVGMAALSGAIVDFCAALGVTRPHLAGNSLGGAIALELASAGHAASVTALSPAGFCTEAEARRALRRLGAMRATTFLPMPLVRATMRSPALRSRILGTVVARPERVSADRAIDDTLALRRAAGFRPIARSAHGYRFTGVPTVPVTIGWGERDQVFPPRQLDVARRRLPAAHHVLLTGCGHVPMVDDPEQVASLILWTTSGSTTPPEPT
jgi:pimeloyl-ACP methyl ester carboxylesterase